jgi:hypothetical protein
VRALVRPLKPPYTPEDLTYFGNAAICGVLAIAGIAGGRLEALFGALGVAALLLAVWFLLQGVSERGAGRRLGRRTPWP